MFDRLHRFCVALAVTAAPAWALAAGDQGAGHETQGAIATVKQGVYSAVTALVVFGIVFAVLAVKVWPVINKGLAERERKIKDEIESAEMARKQAKDALEQYQQSLAQARAEAQKMLDQAKSQQAAISAELKAKADAELGQMRERAMKDIETAKKAALNEIYSETANLAAMTAGKILRREIRPADQAQFVEESLRQLQTARN